jgi:DNA-binding response OmpR family regulator
MWNNDAVIAKGSDMMQRHLPTKPISVLCVDDDPYLTDLLRYALGHDGYEVAVANTGADALRHAQADPPDVVVLDVHLPDISGFTLCTQFRKVMHLPVILLTASNLDADVITGFQHGADDYVSKPFSMQVLSYRIHAVAVGMRRGAMDHGGGPTRSRYPIGTGTFDAELHEIIGEVTIKLTPIQGKILRVLLENEGHVVSMEQLMTKVWHYDAESDVSVVKSHVSNLRKKIATALGDREFIRTIAGLGYMCRQPSPRREDTS